MHEDPLVAQENCGSQHRRATSLSHIERIGSPKFRKISASFQDRAGLLMSSYAVTDTTTAMFCSEDDSPKLSVIETFFQT